jgi:hypothetical protein
LSNGECVDKLVIYSEKTKKSIFKLKIKKENHRTSKSRCQKWSERCIEERASCKYFQKLHLCIVFGSFFPSPKLLIFYDVNNEKYERIQRYVEKQENIPGGSLLGKGSPVQGPER